MTAKSETRQFRMHAKLLYDVIRRQAGTLSKAILEGVMNSIDAKASECRITIDPERVTVTDDGKGFRNRKEIEDWFEVFGQPHDESEKKTYGTFRMGRGQMFAFGRNVWKTGRFSMEVDVQNKGLDYQLAENGQVSPGCTIELQLYDKLLPSDLAATCRDLEHWVKWAPIPIFLNDAQISTDPEDIAGWDHVSEKAFISLKPTGSLAVYNLGIHVTDMPGHRFGTGGVVVARKQLRVNFARNDIQSDCPVWKSIKKLVDTRASQVSLSSGALNDSQRQRIADQLLAGELDWSSLSSTHRRLITATTGRHYDPYDICMWPAISVAPAGDRKADFLMKTKTAFIIAPETMDRFHVSTPEELINTLRRLKPRDKYFLSEANEKVCDFKDLVEGMKGVYTIVPESELTKHDRLWLALIRCRTYLLEPSRVFASRRVHIGRSDVANGWTDGRSYIAINQEWLQKRSFNVKGVIEVARLLLHELCHDKPDLDGHIHDQAFYEAFHDNSERIGEFTDRVLAKVPDAVSQLNSKLTKAQLKTQDKLAAAENAVAALAPDVKSFTTTEDG